MAVTKIDLARQAVAKLFTFGASGSGNEGKVTIERGAQAASYVALQVNASATVDGDLNVGGNLNITGNINEQNVTNLNVADKTITLNDGGAAGSGTGSGIDVEANNVTVAALRWDGSDWTSGDGTTQRKLVTLDGTQTLTNKSLTSPTLTGTPTAPTAATNTNNTQIATTAFVAAAVAAGGATAYMRAATVTGTQDGSNKTFTIGSAVSSGSEQVFLNGQLLTPGSSNDYVISGTTITFQAAMPAPLATDSVRVYGVF